VSPATPHRWHRPTYPALSTLRQEATHRRRRKVAEDGATGEPVPPILAAAAAVEAAVEAAAAPARKRTRTARAKSGEAKASEAKSGAAEASEAKPGEASTSEAKPRRRRSPSKTASDGEPAVAVKRRTSRPATKPDEPAPEDSGPPAPSVAAA